MTRIVIMLQLSKWYIDEEEDIIFAIEPRLVSIGTINLPENFQSIETIKYSHTSILNFKITV